MRTLDQLRVVHLQAQHPVQPHRQLPCHGHLRERTTLPLGQTLIHPTHLRAAPDETFEMTFAKDNAADDGFNRWTINGVAFATEDMFGKVLPATWA